MTIRTAFHILWDAICGTVFLIGAVVVTLYIADWFNGVLGL